MTGRLNSATPITRRWPTSELGGRGFRRAAAWSIASKLLVFAIGALQFSASSVIGAEAGTASQEYRRVYVPADKVEAWPQNGQKYLPIEASEFNSLVDAANQSKLLAVTGMIDAAQYFATLDDDGHFHGRGQWNITLRGSGKAFLPLHELSFAIHEPRWQSAAQELVQLGFWGRDNSRAAQLGLNIARSGNLEFEWSIKTQSTGGVYEIPWRVPPALSSWIEFDLPDGQQPTMDGAVVLETPQAQSAESRGNSRRWKLAFDPVQARSIKISTSDQTPQALAHQLTLSEHASYKIEQRGLELTAVWNLAGALDEQKELTVQVPRGAQLLAAASDDQELSWRVERSATGSTERAVIQLPRPTDRSVLEVTVRAWFPVVLDRPWSLPVLRPDTVDWNTGRSELTLSEQFKLEGLKSIDAAQIGVTQNTATSDVPESYTFESYSPTASITVDIARRRPTAKVRMGSSLVLADPDVTGRLLTEWNVSNDYLHHLSGELAEGWTVETVESIPSEAMAEWFIDTNGSPRRLEVQLTGPAGPNRNVSIIVMGRLQRPGLAAPIAANTLCMVKWSNARVAQHLLTFQSTEPFAIDSIGHLPSVPVDTLNKNDQELVEGVTKDSRIVDLSQAGPGAGLQLAFKRGEYSADVELVAAYASGTLHQTYTVRIEPNGDSIDRLLVFATAPLGNATHWTLKPTDAPIVAERLSAHDPQRKDLPKEGELWLLRLPQPTTTAVEISATVTNTWPNRSKVPLLGLPEAVTQTGRAELRASPTHSPTLDVDRLIPIPLPVASSKPGSAVATLPVAAYRYTPQDCLATSRQPTLWIGNGAGSATSSLIANYLDVESFYSLNGRAQHRAIFSLTSFGATTLQPALPSEATLLSVSVNGQAVAVAQQPAGQPVSIRLPPATRSTTVSISFSTEEAPLSAGCSLRPPVGQSELPTLAGEWKVWLPEEFLATTPAQSVDADFGWRHRLFGPLARSGVSPPFHPLLPADWARAVNGLADWGAPSSEPTLPKEDSSNATLAATVVQPATDPILAQRPLSRNDEIHNLPGWKLMRQPFQAGTATVPVVVLHPPAIIAVSVATMLATFLLGCYFYKDRGPYLVGLLAISAVLALILPPAISQLATGAMWGIVCSVLAQWPRYAFRGIEATTTRQRQVAISSALSLVVIASFASFARAETVGDQSSARAKVAEPAIEQVLIPVDETRKQAGSKYFVSEQFLRKLIGQNTAENPSDLQWILLSADYVGELSEMRTGTAATASTWTLSFGIEALARNARIVLPLTQNDADWQPTAMLEGIPVPLEWRSDGRECTITIEQPGRYTLTVFGVPSIEETEGLNRIHFSIPPAVSATLQLHFPEAITDVKVPGAVRFSASKDAPGMLQAELGQADRLTVEWPVGESKSTASQGLTVTEMSWLRIDSSSTELEVKYLLEGGSRRPDSLTVAYDASWKLESKSASSVDSASAGNALLRRTVKVPVPADEVDRQDILLRFKLDAAVTAGSFRLPNVELTSMSASQRWFALSSDPSLDCTLESKSTTAATSKEFLAKWGPATFELAPETALTNFESNRDWRFAVRPREIDSVVHEVLHVASGLKSMRVFYQAAVTPGSEYRFQFGLTVPPELAIDDVQVLQADRRIATQWVRNSDRHINIFFAEEAPSDYRLSLAGTVPIRAEEAAALPRVTALKPVSGTQQVQLYRDDDVHVDFLQLPTAQEAKASAAELPPLQWLVRQIGVYQLDEADFSAIRAKTTAKKPEVIGNVATTLLREAGSWKAVFHCQLTAQAEDIDAIQIRAPISWVGPLETQSAVPITILSAPLDELSQLLTIRFTTPVSKGKAVNFQLRGPLTVPSGTPVSAPDIHLATEFSGRRSLTVPATIDSQNVAWSTTGVREATLPTQLMSTINAEVRQQHFEIMGDPFIVAAQSTATPLAKPRVRLADISALRGDRGKQIVTSRFVVSSDGVPACTLVLPDSQQLISVTLDDRPALVSAVGPSRWRLVLGPAQLPQLLEIVSLDPTEVTDLQTYTVTRPKLLVADKPLPIDLSLWSVARPRSSPSGDVDEQDSVPPIDQAALRLDRMVSIAEAATPAAADAPTPDGANWFGQWAALLSRIEDQTQQIVAHSTAPSNAAQVARPAEDQITRASERLQAWRVQARELIPMSESVTDSALSTAGRESTASLAAPEQDLRCFVSEGGPDKITLEAIGQRSNSPYLPFGAIALIVLVATLVIWLIRTPAANDFLYRWPHPIGIAIGIMYWAWLWPSWFGLIVVAVSVWLALRFDWPGRSLRAEASTVLRSTRTQ